MTRATILTGAGPARSAAMARLAARATPPSEGELEAVIECLGDASKLVQRRAAETLAALSSRGVAVEARLNAALAAGALRARWSAVFALSLIGPLPLSVVPTLIEVIGDGDGDLRWAAADLLKQIAAKHRPAVVGALIAAASTSGPGRKMALYCLRDLAVAEALTVAERGLDDAEIDVRLAALAALAALDSDRGRCAERIARLIDDPDPRLQRAAAGTLGGLSVVSAVVVEALTRAEQSEDASLRRAAVQSKRRLGL